MHISMADFAKCAGIALQFEGVDSEAEYTEEGGIPSKYGVTVQLAKDAGDMDSFDMNGDGRITPKDIKQLTFDDAMAIYKKVYWDCWKLDELDCDQKALLVLDAALNHGHKVGAKIVQKALIGLGCDAVVADGIYGPQTKKAMAEVETEAFVAAYFESRTRYYKALARAYADQQKNMGKWMDRLERLKEALACM